MRIMFDLEIVGGGFDGAPGLKWMGDDRHPPPDLIYVAVCRKGMHCGSSLCKRPVEHVSYWLAEEEAERPPAAQPYSKQDQEFLTRDAEGELRGRCVYAIGGLLDLRSWDARADVPDMVPA